MTFGEQLTTLRKRKNLSQAELGKSVGTSGDIIGKYERDEVKPSIEMVVKIADLLDVSIDFLTGRNTTELDKVILKRILDIQKLSVEDRGHVFALLDAFLRDRKTKKAYAG